MSSYADKLKQFGAGLKSGLENWYSAYQERMKAEAAKDPMKMTRPEWQDPGSSADMQSVYDQIMNRKDFQFDLNGNALYQQLRNSYEKQGQLGTMNAIGNAAAMTGGYGNTYAAAAGQQAYQQSLEELNSKIPDLYAMALQQYQVQGEQLAQKYAVAADDRAFQYGVYRDTVGDWENDRNFYYQKQRDDVADNQWAAEFGENKRQFDSEMSYKQQQAAAENERWNKQFSYQQFLDERNYNYQVSQDELNRQERYDRYGVEDSHWETTRKDNLAQRAIENEHWDKTNEQTERFHQDDLALSYAGLTQDNEHFYATLDQNAVFHQDDMDLSYAKLGQENSQFWATYGQNENFHQDDLKQQGIENTMAQAYLDLAIGDSKWGQKMDIEDLKKAYLAMGLRYG